MGMFDNLKKQATKAVDEHGDQIADGHRQGGGDWPTRRPRASTAARSTRAPRRRRTRWTSSTAATTTSRTSSRAAQGAEARAPRSTSVSAAARSPPGRSRRTACRPRSPRRPACRCRAAPASTCQGARPAASSRAARSGSSAASVGGLAGRQRRLDAASNGSASGSRPPGPLTLRRALPSPITSSADPVGPVRQRLAQSQAPVGGGVRLDPEQQPSAGPPTVAVEQPPAERERRAAGWARPRR